MGGITPEIYRNDLLRAEIYPDSDDTTGLGDGADGVYDRVEYKYNRQGERIWKKDQNGTVHEYQFDPLGRDTADKVTSVGTGVDNSVLRIAKTYEVRGMVDTITSYDAATAGSAVNEAVFEYDDSELLSKEYQEHEGAKDGSTLYVQYNRDTSATSGQYTKGLRPTSVRYPNGRLVHDTYGSAGSIADALNRLDAIKDDNAGSPGNSLAEYSYLGSGTIVIEDFPQPDVKLNYDSGAAGEYAGFDRFGRVVDQLWYDYGASADRDRYSYGYDRAGNRLYRENTIASGKDEFYSYDQINRLANFDRGDLNVGKTAITGTPVREEDFTLDMTGNWTAFVQKTAGTTDLDQDRTHNKVNEIIDITETTGAAWVTPVEDRNGNMTTVPKPSSLSNGLTLQYDAWDRLSEVKDGVTVVARYEYDGQNRRIKKHLDSQSPGAPDGLDTYIHYFYNSSWQILETRQTTTESDQPENLQPKYQNLWSPRYIDAPILRDENTDQDSLCDDQRLYYLIDANHNVTTLTNTTGDAIEHYLYDPYGTVTIYDATWSSTRSTSSYNNPVLYTGREFDAESGIMHYRNRYYSTELGRFMSRDPIGYTGGINLFEYVTDQPTNRTDPTGLFNVCCDTIYEPLPIGPGGMFGTINVTLQHCYVKLGDCPDDEQQVPAFVDDSPNRCINGKPCSQATAPEIQACVNMYRGNQGYPNEPYGCGNNCNTAAIQQLGRCCLTSNWSPPFYAGPLRGKCLKGHWVGGGIMPGPPPRFVCDQWELPVWQTQ